MARVPVWRRDIDTARLIERSIGVADCHGLYFAALLLHRHGVGLDTALRVLTRRHLTRNPAGEAPGPAPSDAER